MAQKETALSQLSTEHVKELWNQYTGHNAPEGFSGEELRRELIRRGEGEFCNANPK